MKAYLMQWRESLTTLVFRGSDILGPEKNSPSYDCHISRLAYSDDDRSRSECSPTSDRYTGSSSELTAVKSEKTRLLKPIGYSSQALDFPVRGECSPTSDTNIRSECRGQKFYLDFRIEGFPREIPFRPGEIVRSICSEVEVDREIALEAIWAGVRYKVEQRGGRQITRPEDIQRLPPPDGFQSFQEFQARARELYQSFGI